MLGTKCEYVMKTPSGRRAAWDASTCVLEATFNLTRYIQYMLLNLRIKMSYYRKCRRGGMGHGRQEQRQQGNSQQAMH